MKWSILRHYRLSDGRARCEYRDNVRDGIAAFQIKVSGIIHCRDTSYLRVNLSEIPYETIKRGLPDYLSGIPETERTMERHPLRFSRDNLFRELINVSSLWIFDPITGNISEEECKEFSRLRTATSFPTAFPAFSKRREMSKKMSCIAMSDKLINSTIRCFQVK
jgi:hypothetical protein